MTNLALIFCINFFVGFCIFCYGCLFAFVALNLVFFGTMPRNWLGRTSTK